MDLEAWYRDTSIRIHTRSDAKPKWVRLAPSQLGLPDALETSSIRCLPSGRSPGGGPISIEAVRVNATRDAYRALGLMFLAYAMSPQDRELRLMLADIPGDVAQIVLWPCARGAFDGSLGIRRDIVEIRYEAVLPEGNPDYMTTEQDRPESEYPREHLPCCRLGLLHSDGGGGGVIPGEPVGAHFKGTAPSLVWMGKYFLNLALEDNNATLAYLYNTNPAESLHRMSAELRMTVVDPACDPRTWTW